MSAVKDGQKMIRFDTIGSTHTAAEEYLTSLSLSQQLLHKEYPYYHCPPTTIVAQKQTQGRGQGDKKWWSPEGVGLYVSFIRPVPQHDVDLYTSLIGNKIVDALRSHTLLQIHQRGINDIFLDDRKLGGILCEINRGYLIVSVGINIFRPGKVRRDLEKTAVWLNEFGAEHRIDGDTILKLIQGVVLDEI